MQSNKKRKILIIPNEDGFGPSALASYIARALLQDKNNYITILNKSRVEFNKSIYADEIKNRRIDAIPVWGLIQLDKTDGKVSLPGTIKKIGNYKEQSNQYPFISEFSKYDLVLDFGVPAAAKRAAKNGIKSVSVFDHSWSKTLKMILADEDKNQPDHLWLSEADRHSWQCLTDEIEKDEAFVQKLILFPSFITPDIFHQHWKSLLSEKQINVMDYVLGGEVEKDEALPNLTDTIGQLPGENTKIVLIQAGDTPVWDTIIPKIVNEFSKANHELQELDLTFVIYIPDRLKTIPEVGKILKYDDKQRVRGFGYLTGGTIQKILPAFDFLITRAGGGTVNDAIACRVPFVCVEEKGMSQVEAIMEECVKAKLTRKITWDNFIKNPKQVILDEFARNTENSKLIKNMEKIRNKGEYELVKELY